MKKLLKRLEFIPKYARVPMLATVISQIVCYYTPMIVGMGPAHLLSSPLDDRIPVIPAFAYIYIGAFIFWIFNYAYIYCLSPYMCRRLFTADIICKVICTLCFTLYPCTMAQPEAGELKGVGAWLLKIIYFVDQPTNLLPSMHCYMSVIVALPLLSRRDTRTPVWYRAFSQVFAVLICASTVFTKQHVLADVYTGAAMAAAAWFMAMAAWGIIDRRREGKKKV